MNCPYNVYGIIYQDLTPGIINSCPVISDDISSINRYGAVEINSDNSFYISRGFEIP